MPSVYHNFIHNLNWEGFALQGQQIHDATTIWGKNYDWRCQTLSRTERCWSALCWSTASTPVTLLHARWQDRRSLGERLGSLDFCRLSQDHGDWHARFLRTAARLPTRWQHHASVHGQVSWRADPWAIHWIRIWSYWRDELGAIHRKYFFSLVQYASSKSFIKNNILINLVVKRYCTRKKFSPRTTSNVRLARGFLWCR